MAGNFTNPSEDELRSGVFSTAEQIDEAVEVEDAVRSHVRHSIPDDLNGLRRRDHDRVVVNFAQPVAGAAIMAAEKASDSCQREQHTVRLGVSTKKPQTGKHRRKKRWDCGPHRVDHYADQGRDVNLDVKVADYVQLYTWCVVCRGAVVHVPLARAVLRCAVLRHAPPRRHSENLSSDGQRHFERTLSSCASPRAAVGIRPGRDVPAGVRGSSKTSDSGGC